MTRDTSRYTYHRVTHGRDKPASKDAASRAEPESEAAPKKERVIHTRVPAVLERELRRFADTLRVPVSNVIRTILEDALEVADAAGDQVETRLRKAAKHVGSERERLRKKLQSDALAEVYAYQPVTVAQSAACAQCGVDLEPGAAAHLGLSDAPAGKRLFVCDDCLPTKGRKKSHAD